MTGFLLINKPKDWTSHDVVGFLRGVTGIKKIGHAGTLDPFATGLLIIALGRECTKRIDEFKNMPKEYITTMKLGATSDTQDSTGVIKALNHKIIKSITETEVRKTLEGFVGKQKQIPPMFSAKKVKGKKLYELARKGIEIRREPNDIEIFSLKLLKSNVILSDSEKSTTPIEPLATPQDDFFDSLVIKCKVSTGTYIRTLCHDIGKKLEVGAYCNELERTSIGKYKVENSHEPKFFTKENISSYLFNIN